MKKMPCLFQREFRGPRDAVLLPAVTPGCEWVFAEPDVRATRKLDGTACMIDASGRLFKRYDAKRKPDGTWKVAPDGIPCTDSPDEVTGHWPHWVEVALDDKLQPKPEDRWIYEAYRNSFNQEWFEWPGTYEAMGPKIGANPQGHMAHVMYKHGDEVCQEWTPAIVRMLESMTDAERHAYVGILVAAFPRWEGIVFHRVNGDMCKIRRKDYGLRWPMPREDV